MIKKLHIVVIFTMLVAASLTSFGHSKQTQHLIKCNKHTGICLATHDVVITSIPVMPATAFYPKGKFPLKNRFLIRIKALNDYNGLGMPAQQPHIVFTSFFTAPHYFALYRSHISAILNDLYLLRGPPVSMA